MEKENIKRKSRDPILVYREEKKAAYAKLSDLENKFKTAKPNSEERQQLLMDIYEQQDFIKKHFL